LNDAVAIELVGGGVPRPRERCATLPLDTLRRAIIDFDKGRRGR
jgi:hypothetical protein